MADTQKQNGPHNSTLTPISDRSVTKRRPRLRVFLSTTGVFLFGMPLMAYAYLLFGDEASLNFALLSMPLWGGVALFFLTADPFSSTALWMVLLPGFALVQVSVLVIVSEGVFRLLRAMREGHIRGLIFSGLVLVVVWALSLVVVGAAQFAVTSYASVTDDDLIEQVARGALPLDECTKISRWTECYTQAATARGDVSLCTHLPDQLFLGCVGAVVASTGDVADCFSLFTGANQPACVGYGAAADDDPQACQQISNRDERAACQRAAARVLCGQNPLLAIRSVCADNTLAAWGLSPRTGVVE